MITDDTIILGIPFPYWHAAIYLLPVLWLAFTFCRRWLNMKLILVRLVFTYPMVATEARLVFVTTQTKGLWGAVSKTHVAYAIARAYGNGSVKRIEYRTANGRRIPS